MNYPVVPYADVIGRYITLGPASAELSRNIGLDPMLRQFDTVDGNQDGSGALSRECRGFEVRDITDIELQTNFETETTLESMNC